MAARHGLIAVLRDGARRNATYTVTAVPARAVARALSCVRGARCTAVADRRATDAAAE